MRVAGHGIQVQNPAALGLPLAVPVIQGVVVGYMFEGIGEKEFGSACTLKHYRLDKPAAHLRATKFWLVSNVLRQTP